MSKVSVRDSSIGGVGVFAGEPFEAGQVIREFQLEREVTADDPLRPEQGELPEHCPLIDGRFYLVAAPDRYLDHSCDPNSYLRFSAGSIEVVALREIPGGSELTIDYLINNPGGDSWPCRCGASRRRGESGHSFFTLPDSIQREYFPLLAPWFRERYQRELEHLAGPPSAWPALAADGAQRIRLDSW